MPTERRLLLVKFENTPQYQDQADQLLQRLLQHLRGLDIVEERDSMLAADNSDDADVILLAEGEEQAFANLASTQYLDGDIQSVEVELEGLLRAGIGKWRIGLFDGVI